MKQKRNKKMRKIKQLLLILLIIVSFVSCEALKKENQIRLAYVNWAEGIAMTHVAKIVLEEQGYNVRLLNTDTAPIFASLARGNADAFLDLWMPNTHRDYMSQYGETLEILGDNFSDASIGLTVPSYVDINSIEELNEYKQKFKGEIIGIDAGSATMQITAQVIKEYNLDFQLLTSSSAGMTASLERAIRNGDWVVVTGWTPHWKFARYDLKMLDDPKKMYGESESVQTVTRKGFKDEYPFVAQFLKNMHYTNEQIGELMGMVEDSKLDELGALEWVEANRELVNSWIPDKDDYQ